MIRALHYKTLESAIKNRLALAAWKGQHSSGWAARWALLKVYTEGGVVIIHIFNVRILVARLK